MNDKKNDATDAPILQARPQTPTTEALGELGKEILKRNMPFLNDVLKQITTLSVSLLGGGIVFIDDSKIKIMQHNYKIGGLIFFIVALGVAFFGSLPFTDKFSMDYPDSIRESYERGMNRKSFVIFFAGLFLIVGLGIWLLGCLLMPQP